MPLAALRIAAERGLSDVGAEFLHQATVMRGTGAELVAVRRDLAVDARRAHAPLVSVGRKALFGSTSRCLKALQSGSVAAMRVRKDWDSTLGRSFR